MSYQQLLEQAKSLHYPRLVLGLTTIEPGRDGWYAFVNCASDAMLEQALCRLERHTARERVAHER